MLMRSKPTTPWLGATFAGLLCFIGGVWIARSHGLTAHTSPPQASAGSALDRQLDDLSFDGAPLEQVLTALSQRAGAPIDVDWASLAPLNVTPNTPASMRLRNIKIHKALEVILEAAQPIGRWSHYELRDDGSIFITTRARYVETNTVTLVYDTRDIFAAIPASVPGQNGPTRNAVKLEVCKLVMDTIDWESWDTAGGKPGTIAELGGLLIVRQTRENHQSLRNLLHELREMGKPHYQNPQGEIIAKE